MASDINGAARHTPKPWKAVRSATCGHLRAEHNYNSDPRKEWTDEDIALIDSAPDMHEAIEVALRIVHGPNMPDGVAKSQLIAVLSCVPAAIAKARQGGGA